MNFKYMYYSIIRLLGNPPIVLVDTIIREVVGIYIKEEVLIDRKLNI